MLVIAASGCVSSGNKEDLAEALHRYNSAVRWGQTGLMIEYVAAGSTAAQVPRSQVFDGELQITGCQVGSVKFMGEDHAEAVVRVDWYQVRKGRLNTSIVQQTWKYGKSRWQIVEQRHLEGAPFPGVERGSVEALN